MDSDTNKRSRRILVINANQLARQDVVEFLKQQGYCVSEAADGGQAIESFVGSHADAVLMSVEAPVTKHVEAARVLRNRDGGLPIFAMTRDPAEIAANRHLFNDVWRMPLPLPVLAAQLNRHFSARLLFD